MTPEERRMMAEIERAEQWLKDHAPATPGPGSLEHLKLQIRIAADELRLQGISTVRVDPACLARVKRAVRVELAGGAPPAGRRRVHRLIPLWVGGPAAIAAVVAMVVMLHRPTGSPAPQVSLSALDALLEYAEESMADPVHAVSLPNLDALEEELLGFAESAAIQNGYDETETPSAPLWEKLRDELDSLKTPGAVLQAGEDYTWYAAGSFDSESWRWPA